MQWIALMSWLWISLTHAEGWVFNNPYPAQESSQAIYYTSFNEQPKTLDPAKSYSNNEHQFIAQVYEPLLEYDYLRRPYQLIPLTATAMPEVRYVREPGKTKIMYTVYTLHLKPGILFQPHPALAKDARGQYRYHHLSLKFLNKNKIHQLSDFKYTGTRELVSDDYIYQIKRLANPSVNSSVFGILSEYIIGFREYGQALGSGYVDLREHPLDGVKKIDNYTFEITLKGQYAQFMFWLAMPFFAPMPWEADLFYAQPGMAQKNISLGWYPIGTGPFMMAENNPNSRMVLVKNPHYHADYFPSRGSAADEKTGYLTHAGQRLPLINKAVFTLEKEFIPRWNKFLQGYYDLSGTSADSFDQAIQINGSGVATLTPELKQKGLRLEQISDLAIYYLGFNWLDPVVGGASARARALRQAVSIAINYNENIVIFFNGRGQAAQGPIPPGIFGYRDGAAGTNPVVFRWDGIAPKQRPIEDARALMKVAGYPDGIDPDTGQPLILHYDVSVAGGADDKAQFNWMQKQLAQIGVSLNIRATQYNQFQEKIRNGNAQLFSWGWLADYPDPENFLSLLYSRNGKVAHGGENAANYTNTTYDQLFDLMKNRPNDARRQALIDQMIAIVQQDAPWAWGIHTNSFILSQPWMSRVKPNTIGLNTLKYVAVDPVLRQVLRTTWNQSVLWPVGVLLLLLVLVLFPLIRAYQSSQQACAKRAKA